MNPNNNTSHKEYIKTDQSQKDDWDLDRLRETLNKLVQQGNSFESLVHDYENQNAEEMYERLEKSREEMHKQIDDFYNEKKQEISTKVSQSHPKEDINKRADMISSQIAENQAILKQVIQNLETQYLTKEELRFNFDTSYEQITQEVKQLESLIEKGSIYLSLDSSLRTGLEKLLLKKIQLSSTSKPEAQNYYFVASPTKGKLKTQEEESEEDIIYFSSPIKTGQSKLQKKYWNEGGNQSQSYKARAISAKSEIRFEKSPKREIKTEQENTKVPSKDLIQKKVVKEEEKEEKTDKIEKTEKKIVSQIVPKEISEKGLTLDVPDWFDQNVRCKYLHFFQDSSKKLYLLSLIEENISFEIIELDIPFKIPVWHRSIISQQGEIFLTGGLNSQRFEDENSREVFSYDYERKTLRQRKSMNIGRNSHGICILQDYIYVVGGGTNDSGYSTECERFKITPLRSRGESQEWEKVASLNIPTFAPALLSFNNKYLYKIGGMLTVETVNSVIERYDPDVNVWTQIKLEFDMMAYCSASQINNNEILIFGGSDGENKTNKVFSLQLDKEKLEIQQRKLPYYGTFWTNPVVFNDKLFSLQNVEFSKSNAILLGKKKVLCFNGNSWYEIYTDL